MAKADNMCPYYLPYVMDGTAHWGIDNRGRLQWHTDQDQCTIQASFWRKANTNNKIKNDPQQFPASLLPLPCQFLSQNALQKFQISVKHGWDGEIFVRRTSADIFTHFSRSEGWRDNRQNRKAPIYLMTMVTELYDICTGHSWQLTRRI